MPLISPVTQRIANRPLLSACPERRYVTMQG